MRLCEEPRWDSTQSTRCEHVGFANCTLHKKKLKENSDGWRVCCPLCITPFYTKDYNND